MVTGENEKRVFSSFSRKRSIPLKVRRAAGATADERGDLLLTGFTFIELLVVTAIIAMVASFAFIQFAEYRARARDVEREQTMKELQKALALYITEKRIFPQETDVVITGKDPLSLDLIEAGAIQSVKPDPLNTGSYVYRYDSASGGSYTLTYWLETDRVPGKSKGSQSTSP